MHNELQKEKYDRLVAIHKITEFTDLKDIIKIDEDYDLRENYIFRGVKRISYNLIPSSLRKDSKTQQLEINKFILKSEYKPTGDQPNAIAKLVDGFKNGNKYISYIFNSNNYHSCFSINNFGNNIFNKMYKKKKE